MGKLGNSNTTLVRHDFKRATYRALLSEFPPGVVREYFTKVPLVIDGRRLTEPELFELRWTPKGKIPTNWDIATDNELERFVIAQGKSFADVMRRILWLNNNSAVMPGKVLLGWFYPKMESLSDSLDSRDICFTLLTLHNENWIPGLYHRRIRKWTEGDWVHSIVVFILDRTHQEYVDWDLEAIGGPQVMSLPCVLGMPAMEKFGMLADTRHPESVVWRAEDKPAWVGDTLLIGGEAFGRKAAFLDFARRIEVDLGKFDPPDLEVAEITRNYFCPIRKRVVLHAGCVYGAPFFVHTVSHRKIRHHKGALMETMIGDLVREEEMPADELQARHLALMASLTGKADYRWFPEDESLTLNDRHFTKGVPAKIMKGLLEDYLAAGKRDFEYRDFKRRFEISLGQKNSNFEVRFSRLAEKLDAESGGLRIEKTGRGRFRLLITGELALMEGAP